MVWMKGQSSHIHMNRYVDMGGQERTGTKTVRTFSPQPIGLETFLIVFNHPYCHMNQLRYTAPHKSFATLQNLLFASSPGWFPLPAPCRMFWNECLRWVIIYREKNVSEMIKTTNVLHYSLLSVQVNRLQQRTRRGLN